MHESMTSQKIKKLGAGGAKLGGGAKTFGGGAMAPLPRWLRAWITGTEWRGQLRGNVVVDRSHV